MKTSKLMKKIILTILAGIITLILMFPVLLTITNSFMQESQITENYGAILNPDEQSEFVRIELIPDNFTIMQYYNILIKRQVLLDQFWNSVRIVVPIVVIQLMVSTMAGFAFSKLNFRFRDTLFFIYIIVMIMPFQVTVVANYITSDRLGILGTYAAVILPGGFNVLGTFLLRQFMLYIPNEYIDSAKIDGAGYLRILGNIAVPMAKQGIWVLIVLTFVDNWNMVEQPLIFLKDSGMWPLSMNLSSLVKGDMGIVFAAGFMYMALPLLIFKYADTYLVEGLNISGLKS